MFNITVIYISKYTSPLTHRLVKFTQHCVEQTMARCCYLIRTLRAPKGVTTVAGANMYAVKFAASPPPTAKKCRTLSKFAGVI